jgi:hypothetical protein
MNANVRAFLTEKEKAEGRVKVLTDFTEDAGLGKLPKQSDGSFDFDWKN